MIKINLTKVEEIKPVPTGSYEVLVSSLKEETAEITDKESGKKVEVPVVICTFVITEGEYKGNKLFDRFYLNDTSLWRFTNFLKVFHDDLDMDDEEFEVDLSTYKDMALVLEVKLDTIPADENNSEPRPVNKIKSFSPLT